MAAHEREVSRMRKTLLIFLALSGSALAAPLVDGVATPEAHEAVKTLTERGIVKGYPDSLYKGDRPMTRYELTQLLDKLNRYMETGESKSASHQDIRALNNSARALQKQLDELGGRADMSEEQIRDLDARNENRPEDR